MAVMLGEEIYRSVLIRIQRALTVGKGRLCHSCLFRFSFESKGAVTVNEEFIWLLLTYRSSDGWKEGVTSLVAHPQKRRWLERKASDSRVHNFKTMGLLIVHRDGKLGWYTVHNPRIHTALGGKGELEIDFHF